VQSVLCSCPLRCTYHGTCSRPQLLPGLTLAIPLSRLFPPTTTAITTSDQCPECGFGSIDLQTNGDGRWKVEWEPVQCPVGNAPLKYGYQGGNPYYKKLQVRCRPGNPLPVFPGSLCTGRCMLQRSTTHSGHDLTDLRRRWRTRAFQSPRSRCCVVAHGSSWLQPLTTTLRRMVGSHRCSSHCCYWDTGCLK
jgi:hypothetical protein